MNNQRTACDPRRIELFLDHKLSDEDQAAFESHLSDCGDCCRRLEATAASEDIWSGVRDSLQDQQPPADCLRSGESALDSAGDETSSSQATVLKLLAPTDDDRMIGRWGTYEVVGVIGSGGMGVVLKAFDAALNRYVAIKILAPHLGNSGGARKRFSREGQAAAAVVHDNVIEIYSVAETAGLPYLVMPYVRGPSLQRRLDGEGPLAVIEILRVGMQAAAGLAAAHAQGLVHRDVKPANILLADGVERVKLTDFGLARAADDASLTKTGVIAGTPQYMSPEQARGESVDQRSDLFSLGSVLYAVCTGRAPFRAETSYGVLRRITDEEPRAIREINPEIPDWLCRIVARLMSKRPDERFQSAHEIAGLLEECLAHVQQPTVVPLPAALPKPPPRRAWWPFASMIEDRKMKDRKIGHNPNDSPSYSVFSCLTFSCLKSIRFKGVIAMIATLGAGLLGVLFVSATPPDIAGQWTGEGWGQVTLTQTAPGRYTGTFTDTVAKEKEPGKIELQWSRIERRYNGSWSEGEDDRVGNLSIHMVGDEIRGALTTSAKSKINPATPRLADLVWTKVGGGTLEVVASASPVGLAEAVRAFNSGRQKDGLGKDQPPLTEDEVVTAIRWALMEPRKLHASERTLIKLREIAETLMLPPGFMIEAVPNSSSNERMEADRWLVWLRFPDDGPYINIRWRLYASLLYGEEERKVVRKWRKEHPHDETSLPFEERAKARELDQSKAKSDSGPKPKEPVSENLTTLEEALRIFNAHAADDPVGRNQPPLTAEEVIAAIRWFLSDPGKSPVTDKTLAALDQAARTRLLPSNFEFEVIAHFQPNDEMEATIWSVRLRIPAKPDGWTTCVDIRWQPITSRIFGEEERKVIEKWQKKWATEGRPLGADNRDEESERAKAREIDRTKRESAKPPHAGESGAAGAEVSGTVLYGAGDSPTTSPPATVEAVLEEYRKTLVAYDLGFDSVFPQNSWTHYDAARLERYPTKDAWPVVLGHVDTDPNAFNVVWNKSKYPKNPIGGPNAFVIPLDQGLVADSNYATLLFLKGISPKGTVVAKTYTSLVCLGPMAGRLNFASYATALIKGDLSGQITGDSYFDLVVTGKFSGRVYANSYAMIYLSGGCEGSAELKHGAKVYIAGRTTQAGLSRLKGQGSVFLEDSDLPPGEHEIGELSVTVARGAGKSSGTVSEPFRGALAASTSAVPASQNILKNSGVELGDGTPDGWQQGAAIEGVAYSWCKTAAFEGKASLCIEKTAQRYFPIAQWSQNVDRQGNRPALLVSAQVKAEKMTKAILDVSFLDARGEWLSHHWAAFIGSKEPGMPPANHGWKLYSGKVQIPPQAKKLCIGLQVYGPGKVWFDDIRAGYADEAAGNKD